MLSNQQNVIGTYAAWLGIKLVDWSDGTAKVQLLVADHHRNRSGVVHGGVLASILDVATSCAGNFCTTPNHVRLSLTLQMNIIFCAAARGTELIAVSERLTTGQRIWFARAQLYDDNTLVATAQATFRYRTGSENPCGVPIESVTASPIKE